MDLHIYAIYDDGVLRPLTPLALPDKARVSLTIDGAMQVPSDETPKLAEGVQPGNEWERRLLSVARDCGVSLTDVAVGSEGLYES